MQAKQVVDFNYDFNDTDNSIQLTDIIATYIPWADCDYYFNFNFKNSYDEVVASNPCSNRPDKCDQCEGTFWTYNIKAHYVVSHPSIKTENIANYISENEKKAVLNMF